MDKNEDVCFNCCHNGKCPLDKKKCEEFDKLIDQLPTIGYINADGILVLPAECDNGDDWSGL